jgi:hypothetical protein
VRTSSCVVSKAMCVSTEFDVQEAAAWYSGPLTETETVLNFLKEVLVYDFVSTRIFSPKINTGWFRACAQKNELPSPVLQLLNEMIATNAKIRCLLCACCSRFSFSGRHPI